MSMNFSIEGAGLVIKNIEKYSRESQARIQKVIDGTAQTIRTDAIRSINQSPASGITRRSGASKRMHTASSPGNPPRTDSGSLVRSIKALVGRLEAIVGTNIGYGRALEFGVHNNPGYARPWLFPALERQRRNFYAKLKEAIK